MIRLKKNKLFEFFLILILIVGLCISIIFIRSRDDIRQRAAENIPTTFQNPILKDGADPWMIFKNGVYYYTQTTGNNITVWTSSTIQGIESGKKVTVWTPPASGPTCCNIWAPELHFINNKWYIYFAADDGNNTNHRMYVLESTGTDAQGAYVLKGKINMPEDNWAIDGTILQADNGSRYFVWSGWPGATDGIQNLYIAPMSDPWTVSGNRVQISTPTYAFETKTAKFNEGPTVVKRNGKIMIVFSANGSSTDEYCLGMLTNTDGNVLNPSSWTKTPNSIFSKTNEVFGPGHASFTTSPDLKEDWIVYHAAKQQGSGWDRNIRAQKFTWNEDGTPNLGQPLPLTTLITIPAGIPPTIIPPTNPPTIPPTVTTSPIVPTFFCAGGMNCHLTVAPTTPAATGIISPTVFHAVTQMPTASTIAPTLSVVSASPSTPSNTPVPLTITVVPTINTTSPNPTNQAVSPTRVNISPTESVSETPGNQNIPTQQQNQETPKNQFNQNKGLILQLLEIIKSILELISKMFKF